MLDALMTSVIATARSGMLASIAYINASAANIARGSTSGPPAGTVAEAPDGAPRADKVVAAPNVDLAQDAIGALEASLLFRANLAVFKRAHEMTRNMIDAMA